MVTQVSFWDKLDYEIVNNIGTQTVVEKKGVLKFEDVGVQADGQQMRITMVKRRIRMEKVIEMEFYFDLQGKDSKKNFLKLDEKISIKNS